VGDGVDFKLLGAQDELGDEGHDRDNLRAHGPIVRNRTALCQVPV
jgi:hypothetical protein